MLCFCFVLIGVLLFCFFSFGGLMDCFLVDLLFLLFFLFIFLHFWFGVSYEGFQAAVQSLQHHGSGVA